MNLIRKATLSLLFIFIMLPLFEYAAIENKFTISSEQNTCHTIAQDNSVFMGLVIENDDQLIPFFLNSISKLDYNKNHMHVQMNICNRTEYVKKLVADWIEENKIHYREILCIDNTAQLKEKTYSSDYYKVLAEIKDTYLNECQKGHYDYCFILSSNAFVAPHALKHLIQKNKPVLSPLLRPVPEPHDPYRNFFGDITESGYYKYHEDYPLIANRQKLGTFKVPCVHIVYLIQSRFLNQLSFTDDFKDYEFLSFSGNARKNNVDQYICNEREFGFLLHLKDGSTLNDDKAFKLAGTDFEINPTILETIFSPYIEDEHLQAHIKKFNFDDYQIYRVHNKDLYYVDEVPDYIKNQVIKQGANWEEHFHQQFKKYVKPGSVVLDIGSHIGTHTLPLSRLVGNQGTVYAFEPQVKIFCELAINMYLNKCENVKMFHQALGADERWIEMSIPKETWMEQFGRDTINEGHGTVNLHSNNQTGDQAKLVKLDDFQLQNVSFIKIDVEGFEMEVIKGGIETIKRNMPVIIMEIFENSEKQEKIQTIEKLGYTHSKLSGDDYLFIPLDRLGLSSKLISVVWEGSYMDLSSLSHVNRYFTEQLMKMPQIKLTCVGPNTLSKNLESIPELKNMLNRLSHRAPADTQITIRHIWPPNWQPPPQGKWVLIQPWEFGALPKEWVQNLQNVDEIWAPTDFVKREYVESGVPENKIVVVPNGIDPHQFHPDVKPFKLATNKKFKFLFLGGTIHRKAPDILLKSYLKAFNAADDVCLVVKDFGSKGLYAGQTNENLFREAQKTPNAPEIVYFEEMLSADDIASLYTACDCLVYPYRGEGFALPVLEALACGLPVLVTEGGATDDFVTKDFGWFIPSLIKPIGHAVGHHQLVKEGWMLEPDEEALAMQMRWIAQHPAEARTKGLAASQHVRQYWTWEKAAALAASRLQALCSP